MKYYATIDADGRRTGTYRAGRPDIPEGAIEIDRATFEEWVNNDSTRRWANGKLEVCDPPVHVPTWDEIRAKRDGLLRESDWTQGRDIPAAVAAAWQPYRKALRDLPQVYEDPAAVIWPTGPG